MKENEYKKMKDSFLEKVRQEYQQNCYLLRRCAKASNTLFYKVFPCHAYMFKMNNDQSYTLKLIASLYCKNPLSTSKEISFGTSCRDYYNKKGSSTFLLRFEDMVNSEDRRTLYNTSKLLRIITLLETENIYINYEKLFDTLWYWGSKEKDNLTYDFYNIKLSKICHDGEE